MYKPLAPNDLNFLGFLRCTYQKNGILLRNKSNFVSLKRILPILILLFTVLFSSAQESRNPVPASKKISFYPNPATSFITFDLQDAYQKGVTLTVFNFMGKKMSETQAVNAKTVISLTDYSRGTYIYHLVDRSGKVIDTGKFQVSK